MKRFLIAFSRRTDSNTELKFSVKELSDEVSSHALLCPQRTFILYEALGESIDDIYAQLNTISFFNIIRLDFSNLPQAIGKIYMLENSCRPLMATVTLSTTATVILLFPSKIWAVISWL